MSTHKVSSTTVDRSRDGYLVHDAEASGRFVGVHAYVEGPDSGDAHVVISTITCRTQEQAAAIAKLLREAKSCRSCETPLTAGTTTALKADSVDCGGDCLKCVSVAEREAGWSEDCGCIPGPPLNCKRYAPNTGGLAINVACVCKYHRERDHNLDEKQDKSR